MTETQGWPDANKVNHSQVGSTAENQFEDSGKEMGLVKAPIVSMHETSQAQGDITESKKEFKLIDNANYKLNHHIPVASHVQFNYPFEDLVLGQGVFIPVEEGNTTDKLVRAVHKQIDTYRKQASEVERDENGDDVMEDVAINTKKRNEDGTIQLDDGMPRLSIKSGFRPKLIGPTFAVKAVVKGDQLAENNEAEGDGVLVIRMS